MSGHADRSESAGRVAAFFDLDKTVIARSSTLAFGRPFFDEGLISRRTILQGGYAQLMFMFSGLDHDQMERMREHLATLCAGWDVDQIRTIVQDTLHDVVDPLIFAEAADLIADHRARGHDIVIVSASGEEVVSPIAAMLGATHAVATRMEVADGKYTGEIEFYCYGEGKVTALEDHAATYGYNLAGSYAYSDSITDLPMLCAVGHPTAVNPDRALRREAGARGWPVLTFASPISLRSRAGSLRSRATTRGFTVVGAAGLVALGAGTLALRRGLRRR